VPNQACFWALEGIPFQTFAAAPVPDSTNFMDQLSTQLPPLFNTNTAGTMLGSWRAVTNEHAIIWADVPFLSGFLSPAYEETNSSFIFAGLFPNTRKLEYPPPGLFQAALGRTNLAYYDWEIGGARLQAWLNMTQLGRVLAGKPQLSAEAPASKWGQAVVPKMGNVGTSLTVTAPDRMMLVRTSPHGFTGFETALLAGWLESVSFPWGYELPVAPSRQSGDRPGYTHDIRNLTMCGYPARSPVSSERGWTRLHPRRPQSDDVRLPGLSQPSRPQSHDLRLRGL
jgi:hypothetical protein